MENAYGEDPIRLEQAISCHNAYLGLSWSFPKGWWVFDLNSSNFNPERGDTRDPALLDIIYGDGYRYLDLAFFANHSSSSRRNFLGFYLSAEFREDSRNIGQYMASFEERLSEKYGGAAAVLLSGIDSINGISFEKRIFEISLPNSSFRILSLCAGLQNGYFLNIMAYHWPENKNAVSSIFDALNKALTLE